MEIDYSDLFFVCGLVLVNCGAAAIAKWLAGITLILSGVLLVFVALGAGE